MKAEKLFSEAEQARRSFVRMAGAEGFSEGEIEERWPGIERWAGKERNAELWKGSVLGAGDDESVDEIVESMDAYDLEFMTYMEPEDYLAKVAAEMAEWDRQLKSMINVYAAYCAKEGMSNDEIVGAVANVLGREVPEAEDDDPFGDDTLE